MRPPVGRPPSEYDPVGSLGADPEDLLRVRELFSQAARPFVAFPWSWVAWAFPPFRPFGVAWQLAGVLALWPQLVDPLRALAGITFAGNLWMAWQVWKREPRQRERRGT